MPKLERERSKQNRYDPAAFSGGGKGGKGGGKGGKGGGKGGYGSSNSPGAANAKPAALSSAAGAQVTFRMNKKLGQHLLKNPGIVDKIVAAGDIKPTDTVYEVGPGTGNLTMLLLEKSKKVVAQEFDPRMAAEVRKRAIGAGRMNLEVQDGDVLRADWPVFDCCIANLPYQISSPFTFRLLAHRPAFRCAVLMFQKEFAERLIAKVGEKQYGRLAVNTRLFVKVTCVCKVSRGSFNPPPEVDSMVVKMVPRDPPIDVDFREWDGLMRICFGRKNKVLRASFGNKDCINTLEANYKTWCALTGNQPVTTPFKEHVMDALKALGILEQRAIKIDLDMYFRLLLEFNKRGIHFSNQTARVGGGGGQTSGIDGLFEDGDEAEDMDE